MQRVVRALGRCNHCVAVNNNAVHLGRKCSAAGLRVAQARANQARLMTSFQGGRSYHTGAHGNDKLDEIFPKVVDFPGRHIGPRKHESKAMLTELGYNVSVLKPQSCYLLN